MLKWDIIYVWCEIWLKGAYPEPTSRSIGIMKYKREVLHANEMIMRSWVNVQGTDIVTEIPQRTNPR